MLAFIRGWYYNKGDVRVSLGENADSRKFSKRRR